MSIRSGCLIVLFRSSIFLLISCLLYELLKTYHRNLWEDRVYKWWALHHSLRPPCQNTHQKRPLTALPCQFYTIDCIPHCKHLANRHIHLSSHFLFILPFKFDSQFRVPAVLITHLGYITFSYAFTWPCRLEWNKIKRNSQLLDSNSKVSTITVNSFQLTQQVLVKQMYILRAIPGSELRF